MKVLWLVAGDPGVPGLHVPRAVVGELRARRDCVTVLLRHTVGQTVRVRALKRNSVTLTNVQSQVKLTNGVTNE